MPFPSVLNTFNRPNPTDRLNSPSHSALHNTVSSALGQVEAVIGVEGASSVVGTLQYLIKSPASDGGGHVQAANRGGTGQTTFTKGDILVAQSSSVLSKLSVGSDGSALTADSSQATGLRWGGSSASSFLVSGTWTKPSGAKLVLVSLVGAGGGGGSSNSVGDFGGGGGGGGALSSTTYYADLIPSSMLLTVSSLTAASSNGVNTTFGIFLTANGGTKGADATNPGVGAGGAGGTATGSMIAGGAGANGGGGGQQHGGGGGGAAGSAGSGQTGGVGGATSSIITLGAGGTSPVSSVGGAGKNYGGGGAGGDSTFNNVRAGGTGGGGYAIVTTYL